MIKKQDYKRYGYCDNSPLIGKDEQYKEYFDQKFANIKVNVDSQSIENAVSNNINDVNEHLQHVECHILHEIREHTKPMCTCNLATKDDIKKAVNEINSFTEVKFDEVDFKAQFTDLNEMVSQIKDKVNNN